MPDTRKHGIITAETIARRQNWLQNLQEQHGFGHALLTQFRYDAGQMDDQFGDHVLGTLEERGYAV